VVRRSEWTRLWFPSDEERGAPGANAASCASNQNRASALREQLEKLMLGNDWVVLAFPG